jgi:hypothetical protein
MENTTLTPSIEAKRERVSQFVGIGCLIQGIALLSPFVLGAWAGIAGVIVGIILLIILFIIGAKKAKVWRCGNCKNPIANADIQMCPVCKAKLS